MHKYKNLTIIGTSHISQESIDEVKEVIEREKPQIIALELDKNRFFALTSKAKKSINPLKLGLKVFLIAKIGAYIEKKLGKLVGVSPGSEMIEAIKLAKINKIQIALIDQNIEITLKDLSKAITLKTIFKMIRDIFNNKNKEIKIDLRKVPKQSLINKVLQIMKRRYPEIYHALISKRDAIMAKRIRNLMEESPENKITMIIGAGHVSGILKILRGN